MYARVTLAQLQPGQVDELQQFLHDNVVPAAQRQQGFKGLLLLFRGTASSRDLSGEYPGVTPGMSGIPTT